MTFIEISDLTTADSKLSAGADSFLNELQKTETTQIFGGWRGGWHQKDHDKNWKKDDGGWKKEEKWDYKEKRDYSYYYEEKHSNKHKGGWKKDC